jgi:hypothetical protein
MTTIAQYIVLYMDKKGIGSISALSREFDVSRQYFSRVMKDPKLLSEDHAVKMERELGLPEGALLAQLRVERAVGKDAKRAWKRIAKQLTSTAAGTAIAATLLTGYPVDSIAENMKSDAPLYILCQIVVMWFLRVHRRLQSSHKAFFHHVDTGAFTQ